MDADDIGNLTGRPIPSTGIMAADANGKLLRSYIVPYDISYMGMISLLLVTTFIDSIFDRRRRSTVRNRQDPENPY